MSQTELHYLFSAMWMLGVSYLAWRLLLALLRTRWARVAYPRTLPVQPPDDSQWRDRCRGSLVGLAIGDAVNLPAESLPRWFTRIRYPKGPAMRRGIVRFLRRSGDVSDDTQLTIAVARSINRNGEYSHERFIDELAKWSYFRIGAGRASANAARAARRGRTAPKSNSTGNGAAIRVAPLAIANSDRTELAERVRRNAVATHNTEDAINAAVFVAMLIHECLTSTIGVLDNPRELAIRIRTLSDDSGFYIPTGQAHVAPSGNVHESIPAIVRTLISHGSDFPAAMKTVFRAGGDTDSIGAIVAACIGAQIGYEALPEEWRSKVQHHDTLLSLADSLAEHSSKRTVLSAKMSHLFERIELVRVSGPDPDNNLAKRPTLGDRG